MRRWWPYTPLTWALLALLLAVIVAGALMCALALRDTPADRWMTLLAIFAGLAASLLSAMSKDSDMRSSDIGSRIGQLGEFAAAAQQLAADLGNVGVHGFRQLVETTLAEVNEATELAKQAKDLLS